ncbi:RES family NAD+ phosphorylase [Neorhizobium alkalisoli]|uniref:RES domain-containing protein n=1 Tax=Neorhizobium alkalisoli TaxID=528178 RepID=A0A561R3Z7_9HYPH|nr:RES family NAD+ phosphorylase [Neorhizobium alkalisoli]TWF57322.1 RES domain-containing protein [Neorhizobium alkalisoli]
MYLWRISNYADLSGRGGLLAAGRWHRRGNAVVYCSDHPSTALLEILVHVDLDEIPTDYTLLKIACPEGLPVHRLSETDVDLRDLRATQDLGTSLLSSDARCLIDVPSAVMPQARNILINPRHAGADSIRIETAYRYPFDSRLLR